MTSLLDILSTEICLSQIILNNNDVITTKSISKTCKLFNNIVKNDMDNLRNEYMIVYVPDEFVKIATKKMFDCINANLIFHKKYNQQEYENAYNELSNKINKCNYENILKVMQYKHEKYMLDRKMNGVRSYMYSFIENEYIWFITNKMNHVIL